MDRPDAHATATLPVEAAAPRRGRFRWVGRIALGLLAVVAVFCVVAALQPAEYRVERTASVDAPASAAFAQVNEFRNWNAWSPWAKLDPACVYTFEGPASGTGAVYKWSGNNEVGEGKMTITESRPNELVRIDLEFVRPFPDRGLAEFTFREEAGRTAVTWAMSGRKNFVAKAICLFVSMDKMLGADFEKGLSQLKAAAEAKPGR